MDNDTLQPDDYWFFVSYSSNDYSEYLTDFCTDLAKELRRAVPIPASVETEIIGFRDKKDISPGANWRKSLSRALQASRVLLCLYSKSYFASEYCGKEFQVFLDRVTSQASTLNKGDDEPRLIIPILWDLPHRYLKHLPLAVESFQYKYEDFGDLYATKGLHHLMKVKSTENTAAYNGVVSGLADLISEQAQAHPMKPLGPLPLIEQVKSAFHVQYEPPVTIPSHPITQLPKDAPIPAAKGPDAAWFVYIAGREADYDKIRTDRKCYGTQGGYDWKPYYPLEDRVGTIATSIASNNGIQPETLLISEKLVEHLRQAEDDNTPVVLIIDPWTMRLEEYTKPLDELDRNRLATSTVLVVWNEEDPETSQQAKHLREDLEKIFHRSVDPKEICRDSIRSTKGLKEEISARLKSMRNKIMNNPKPLLPVETTTAPFPTLKVPESSNPASEPFTGDAQAVNELPAPMPTGGAL